TRFDCDWSSDVCSSDLLDMNAPVYSIAQVNSPTSLDLDSVWGSDSASAQTYSIYQCYFIPPSDFHQFICLWDPSYNWQLHLDVRSEERRVGKECRSRLI